MTRPETTLADRILARVVDMEAFEASDLLDLTTVREEYARSRIHDVLRALVDEGHIEVLQAPRRGRGAHKMPGRWRYRP